MIYKGVFVLKYTYKKSCMFFWLFLCISPATVFLMYIYSVDRDIIFVFRMIFILLIFFGYFIPVCAKEYVKRSVVFKIETVVFDSFRIAKKVRNFTVRYEDVLSLETTKIPLLGIYKVSVRAKNVPWPIPVTWCMAHKNELFSELCKRVQDNNPDAYIDNRLLSSMD